MFFFLGLCCIVFTGICIYLFMDAIDAVKTSAEGNFKKAMVRYRVNATSRYHLNNFHTEFQCCGVGGMDDWLNMPGHADEKNDTAVGCEVKFPPTCCDILREPATKTAVRGCKEALVSYADNLQFRLLSICTLFMLWVLLLLGMSLFLGGRSPKPIASHHERNRRRSTDSNIKIQCKNAIFVRRTPSRERSVRARIVPRLESPILTTSGSNVGVERHTTRLPNSNDNVEQNPQRAVVPSKSDILVVEKSAGSNR